MAKQTTSYIVVLETRGGFPLYLFEDMRSATPVQADARKFGRETTAADAAVEAAGAFGWVARVVPVASKSALAA